MIALRKPNIIQNNESNPAKWTSQKKLHSVMYSDPGILNLLRVSSTRLSEHRSWSNLERNYFLCLKITRLFCLEKIKTFKCNSLGLTWLFLWDVNSERWNRFLKCKRQNFSNIWIILKSFLKEFLAIWQMDFKKPINHWLWNHKIKEVLHISSTKHPTAVEFILGMIRVVLLLSNLLEFIWMIILRICFESEIVDN